MDDLVTVRPAKPSGFNIPAPPAGVILGQSRCRCGAVFQHNPRARTAQGCLACERTRGDLAEARLRAAGLL